MSRTVAESAQLIPIDRLRQASWNANRVPAKTLAKIRRSIEQFGVVENLVARPHPEHAGDFEVISGNHRLQLLRELGLAEVPVVVVDVDDAHARILAQTLNRTRGADDPVAYAELLDNVLSEMSRDEVLDFLPETDSSLDYALSQLPVRDLGDEDDAPAVPESEPESRPGEVYELGPHRLLCGDATSLEDLALLMGEEQADAVITDPPYNVDYGGKNDFLNLVGGGIGRSSRQVAGDALSDDAFGQFLLAAFAGAATHARPGAPIYVWHADSQGLPFRFALIRAGWLYKQSLVWVKSNIIPGRQDYQWKHEPVLYGWKPGAAHPWYGDRRQPTVLEAPKPNSSELHPTMKPVALLEQFLWNSTERGGVVLDPFAGSGSTLIAAEKNGRRCFCLELDPRYCDVIRRRYGSYAGGRAL